MFNSVIRVLTSLIVGGILSETFFGYIDDGSVAKFIVVCVTGIYYLIARLLEHYVSSSFGILLGLPTPPYYVDDLTIYRESDDDK